MVLNFEGLDVEVAQRIIDFTSGSCYAIGGNLRKVSNLSLIHILYWQEWYWEALLGVWQPMFPVLAG